MIFSWDLLRRGMKKKLFLPTFVATLGLAFFPHLVLGASSEVFLSKKALFISCAYSVYMIVLFIIRQTLVENFTIKALLAFPFYRMFSAAVIGQAVIVIISFGMQALCALPWIGPVFFLTAALTSFAFNLLALGFAPFAILSIFALGQGLKLGNVLTIEGHFVELKKSLSDKEFLIKAAKGITPMLLVGWMLWNAQPPIPEGTKAVFALLGALIITPFINYFFLVSMAKTTVRHQRDVSMTLK